MPPPEPSPPNLLVFPDHIRACLFDLDGVLVDAPATAVRLVEDYQLPDDIAVKVRSVADDGVLAGIAHKLLEERADDPA